MLFNYLSTSLFILTAIAAIASLAFWKNRTLRTPAYLFVAIVLLVAGMWATIDILGSGRPIRIEALFRNKLEMIAFTYTEGEGIYLFGKLVGEDVPIYYTLPWNEAAAKELQERMENSEEKGTVVVNLWAMANMEALTTQDTPEESFMEYAPPYVAPPKPPEEEHLYGQ